MAATLLSSSSFAQTHPQTNPPATKRVSCTPTPAKRGASSPTPTPKPLPCVIKHHPDTSLSLGVYSQLTIDRTQDLYGFAMQGTAPSTGTLGTFRQTFSPWLGYSVNLGYARVSEQYRNENSSYGSPGNLNIDANMYESSITYVAHTRVNKRFSLFGDAGPGLLTFLPVHRGADAIDYFPESISSRGLSVQVRPAGVFGSGADLRLSRHFDLRAEYRGLIYNNPDFRTGDTLSNKLTLTSEPTLSLVYHVHQPVP